MGMYFEGSLMMPIVILFLSLILTIACSKNQTPSPTDTLTDTLSFSEKNRARNILTGDHSICEGECAESVAAFYLYYTSKNRDESLSYNIKLCSATLISSNRILTNKHCIENVMKAGDVCNETTSIEVKFPKTKNKPYAVYKCKKILSTSEDYWTIDRGTQKPRKKKFVPDWAVIELTSSVKDRKPVQIKNLAIDDDNLPVTLFPVYFDQTFNPPQGVIREVRCHRVFNNGGVYIFANDTDSPLFRIQDCTYPLVLGNSGTGVFYENASQLLGVMATSDSIEASGTMAHCIPDFKSGNNQCIFPDDQEFVKIMKTISYFNKLHIFYQNYVANFAPFGEIQDVDWFEPNDSEKYKIVETQYKDSWMRPIHYLLERKAESLAVRYKLALQKLLLPKVPKCAKPQISDSINLYMFDMTDWNKIYDYDWTETIETSPTGSDVSVLQEVRMPKLDVYLRAIPFGVKKQNGRTFLKAVEPQTPEPLKSVEIDLPACS